MGPRVLINGTWYNIGTNRREPKFEHVSVIVLQHIGLMQFSDSADPDVRVRREAGRQLRDVAAHVFNADGLLEHVFQLLPALSLQQRCDSN